MVVLLLILGIVSTFAFAQAFKESDVQYGKISKGVYYNKLADVRFYETSIPITFAVELPDSFTIPTPTYHCNASDFICAVLYKSQSISKTLIDDVIKTNPILAETLGAKGRKARGLIDAVGYTNRFLFGLAMDSDVGKLQVSMDVLNRRQIALENAVNIGQQGLTAAIANISTYSVKLQHAINTDFDILQHELKSVTKLAYQNELALSHVFYNNIRLQYFIYFVGLFNEAGADCRNGLLPRSILPTSAVHDRMDLLASQLKPHGWKLATDVNGLWKAKIVDCFFSSKQLDIVVHVPIIRADHSFEIFEIIPVAYQFQEFQCILSQFTQYVATMGNDVIPITDHFSRFCKPEDKQFCLMPSYHKDSTGFATCANKIFNGTPAEINEHCIFECSKANATRITEISEGQIAVTNPTTLETICDGHDTIERLELKESIGAIFVNLSCKCQVIVNGDRSKLLRPPFPCISKTFSLSPTVTRIIPTQMSRLRNMTLDELIPVRDNWTDIIDFRWREKIPIINISTPTPYNLSQNYIAHNFMRHFDQSSSTVLVWLTFLTCSVFILFGFVARPLVIGQASQKTWPSTIAGLLLQMSPAFAEEDTNITVGKAMLQLLNAIEITNIIVIAIGLILAVFAALIVWKIFRFVKATYKLTKSLVMDSELDDRRGFLPK